MAVKEKQKVQALAAALADAALAQVYNDTGIDLSGLPPIMNGEQLAPVLGVSVGALANDRYRHVGIPFIKHGRRIRYLRSDVVRYLLSNRIEHV
jgi:hypothetical protein